MFDDITFESDYSKLKWGTILGGVGLGLLSTGIVIGCVCRCYCKKINRKNNKLKEEPTYSHNIAPIFDKEIDNASMTPIYIQNM